jgi:hypothetical protein
MRQRCRLLATLDYLPFYFVFLASFLHAHGLEPQALQAFSFRFGVDFAVSKALTGECLLTLRASFKRKWLRRRPVFLGLLCFFGSGM